MAKRRVKKKWRDQIPPLPAKCPIFVTEPNRRNPHWPRVYLHCSTCGGRIEEIKSGREVRIDRTYDCLACKREKGHA